MKSSIKYLLAALCLAALSTAPAHARGEPDSSPTPSPSASPSPTPPEDDHHGGDDDGGDDHGGGGEKEHSGLSLHGLYEGTTSAGAVVILYVEKNTHIQVNVLDAASQSIGFAEGNLNNGSFAFTLSNGQAISGTGGEHNVSGTVGTASFVASRPPEFGQEHNAVGRFVGVANGPGGESRVMFVIDSEKRIALLQTSGTPPNLVRTGGFGTITAPGASATAYTFTLNQTIGSSSVITGSFTITDGVFQGSFKTSAGTFTVNSFKSTLANRMANIATRALVGQGQGQLIGGFIITGGPKLVMIRAIGPSMAALGVSPVLDNPSVALYAGSTPIAQNDDWKTNSNAADITASGLAPTNDFESALLVRLEPGAYTMVVNGSNTSATGIALVEVYEVNHD